MSIRSFGVTSIYMYPGTAFSTRHCAPQSRMRNPVRRLYP